MASRPTRLNVPIINGIVKCETQKSTFASYDDALTHADNLMAMDRAMPGCHIGPYKCERCGWWHVGNRRITFTDDTLEG